jgi:hypothetical protein
MKKLNKLIMTTALMAMTALPVSADIQMMLVDRGVQQDTFSNGERDYTESVFHYMVEIAAVNEDVYFHDFYWDTVPDDNPIVSRTVFSQGYSAIPEPNTVVVFLFGAAILYLRQKFIC